MHKNMKSEVQGARKVSFTACLCSWQVLDLQGPFQLYWTTFLMSRSDYSSSATSCACRGKLRTKFTSPTAKSASPGQSDLTLFACWGHAALNPNFQYLWIWWINHAGTVHIKIIPSRYLLFTYFKIATGYKSESTWSITAMISVFFLLCWTLWTMFCVNCGQHREQNKDNKKQAIRLIFYDRTVETQLGRG